MHIILETPRLILRRFTEADAPLIYRLNRDPEVIKYIHEPGVQNVEQAQQIILRIILPQYQHNLGRWAVHTKPDRKFIGWCGLKFLAESNEVDIGYRFHSFAWGKGYATEAAQNTLAYGFNQLNLNEIIGRAHAENTGSIKVLQKIGMHFVKDTIEDDCPVKVFRAAKPVKK